MALNAKKFATDHLTWDHLHWQQYAALSLYSAKFAGVEKDEALSRFCCKDIEADWGHLSSTCNDSPGCANEPARPSFIREDWKSWGAATPTAFPPWYLAFPTTTEPLVATTPVPGFLRSKIAPLPEEDPPKGP